MTKYGLAIAGFAFLLILTVSTASAASTSGVSYEFNVDGERGGWGRGHSISPLTVLGGVLQCTVTGEDPYFESPDFSVNAAENPVVLIRMKVSAPGMCQIMWETSAEYLMGDEKVRGFQSGEANEWELHVLNMEGNPKWTGVITQLRIDPPWSLGQVEIDFVRICSVADIPANLSIESFTATNQVALASGHPFNVTARIMNSGSQPAINVKAALTTPVGMEIQGSEVKTVPMLVGRSYIDLTWTLSSIVEASGSILLSVTVDGQAPLSSQYYAHVRLNGSMPSTPTRPEIVMCHIDPWVLKDISQWEYVLDNIDVIKLYLEDYNSVHVSDLRNLVDVLNRHGIKIAVEVGGLNPWYADKDNQTAEYSVRDELNAVKKLTDPISLGGAGGVISYLDFDGAIRRILYPGDGTPTNHTIETATDEYVKAVRLWKQAYPGLKINELTSPPNWGWKGAAAYWNYFEGQESNHYDDYFIVLQKILQKTEAAGLSIDGLTIDDPYDYATGSYGLNNSNSLYKVDWFARLKDLVKYAESQSLPVNLIFNSERGGDKLTGSSQRYFNDTIAYINEYHRLIGVPSRYVIQSWYYYPDLIVPETTPYTMTYLVSEVIRNVHEYTRFVKANSTLSCECLGKIAYSESINISCTLNPIHEDTTIIFTMTDPNGKIEVVNTSKGVNGSASYTFTPDLVGVWSVKASWLGDSAHLASEAEVSFTVVAPLKPAAIGVKSLLISKASVKSGEEVTVNATLENTGEMSGAYTLVFSLDGVEKDSSEVTLDGGKTVSKSVKFSSGVEGIHMVSVGGESVKFEVEKVQTGIDGYSYESMFLGLILVTLILITIRKKQNTQ